MSFISHLIIGNELSISEGISIVCVSRSQRCARCNGFVDMLPALGFQLHAADVKNNLVAGLAVRIAGDTAFVDGIEATRFHIGVVTAAHQLVEDNHLFVEVDVCKAVVGHATHVTATIERTEFAGVVFV